MADAEVPDMDGGRRRLLVLLEPVEVAKMLRISDRALETSRNEGRGPPYIRLGKGGRAKDLYNLDPVLKWIEEDCNRGGLLVRGWLSKRRVRMRGETCR